MAETDAFLMEIIGANRPPSSLVLLNVILALQDVRMFQTQAFDSWLIENSQQNVVPYLRRAEEVNTLASLLGYVEPMLAKSCAFSLRELLECFELSASEAVWVARSTMMVPDWLELQQEGPWNGDARREFLLECLPDFHRSHLTLAGISAATENFDRRLSSTRSRLPGNFLPKAVMLVEGPTEALLLPKLCKLLAFDLDFNGIATISAGGASQLARRYLDFKELTALPVVAVLDADAEEQAELIRDVLRDKDRLHVLDKGEIEDIFDTDLLVRFLNNHLQLSGIPLPVNRNDFSPDVRRTAILNRLWRDRGLGNFDKIGFAQTIVDSLSNFQEVPADAKVVTNLLRGVLSGEQGSGR